MRFLVVFPDGRSALYEADSRAELDRQVGDPAADVVELHEETGFPLTFGKQRGVLEAWERAMADYLPYSSSRTKRKDAS